MPRPKAAALLLWWRGRRVDVVDLVVDLVNVDLDIDLVDVDFDVDLVDVGLVDVGLVEVDLVDVDLVDVDLVDADLVDIGLERAIGKKEIKNQTSDVRLTHRLVHCIIFQN